MLSIYHVFLGSRLWLIPKPEADDHVSVGMRDFEPDFTIPDHNDFNKFIKFINNRIQEDPIPGQCSLLL